MTTHTSVLSQFHNKKIMKIQVHEEDTRGLLSALCKERDHLDRECRFHVTPPSDTTSSLWSHVMQFHFDVDVSPAPRGYRGGNRDELSNELHGVIRGISQKFAFSRTIVVCYKRGVKSNRVFDDLCDALMSCAGQPRPVVHLVLNTGQVLSRLRSSAALTLGLLVSSPCNRRKVYVNLSNLYGKETSPCPSGAYGTRRVGVGGISVAQDVLPLVDGSTREFLVGKRGVLARDVFVYLQTKNQSDIREWCARLDECNRMCRLTLSLCIQCDVWSIPSELYDSPVIYRLRVFSNAVRSEISGADLRKIKEETENVMFRMIERSPCIHELVFCTNGSASLSVSSYDHYSGLEREGVYDARFLAATKVRWTRFGVDGALRLDPDDWCSLKPETGQSVSTWLRKKRRLLLRYLFYLVPLVYWSRRFRPHGLPSELLQRVFECFAFPDSRYDML